MAVLATAALTAAMAAPACAETAVKFTLDGRVEGPATPFLLALDLGYFKAEDLDVTIEPIENPRVELEEHYYNAKHTKLVDLGLEPHLLSETLVESMFGVIERHKDRVIADRILPRDRWRGADPPA